MPLDFRPPLVAVLVAASALVVLSQEQSFEAVSIKRNQNATMASDSTHVYVLITHYAGNTSCDPAAGLNNSRKLPLNQDTAISPSGVKVAVSSGHLPWSR